MLATNSEVCGVICALKTALRLGKQREKQVRRLKIQLSHVQDVARREKLMNQMTALLTGTLDLGEIVYTNQFVLIMAKHLKYKDASFTTEDSIDFILRCFVVGLVQGKGQPLTVGLKTKIFQKIRHRGLPLYAYWKAFAVFRSFMPDMASPDRLVIIDGKSLDYSDPNHVIVRSSWLSNMFFGAKTDRDEYLQRLFMSRKEPSFPIIMSTRIKSLNRNLF